MLDYLYELRRGEDIVATGHLSRNHPLEVGERLELAGQIGVVRTIQPRLGEPTLHVTLQAYEG